MKSLGKTASVRYIEADSLAIIQDSELDYAVRDCRSVIIAADATLLEAGVGASSEGEQTAPLL